MRVLGVDPGLRHTGYGLLEASTRGPGLVDAGVIHTSVGSPLPLRLRELYAGFRQVIDEGRPDLIVMEDPFAHPRFPRTAIVIGQVCGVIQLAAAHAGVPVDALPPALVKRAVAASGQAGKRQVQRTVRFLLALAEDPVSHVADALALALTAASRRGLPVTLPARLRGSA